MTITCSRREARLKELRLLPKEVLMSLILDFEVSARELEAVHTAAGHTSRIAADVCGRCRNEFTEERPGWAFCRTCGYSRRSTRTVEVYR